VKLQTKLTLFVPKRPVRHRHYTLRRQVVAFASVDDNEKAMEDLGWLVRRPRCRDTRVFKRCRGCGDQKPRRLYGNSQWQRDGDCRRCKRCTSRARDIEAGSRCMQAFRALESFAPPSPRPASCSLPERLEHPSIALPLPRPQTSSSSTELPTELPAAASKRQLPQKAKQAPARSPPQVKRKQQLAPERGRRAKARKEPPAPSPWQEKSKQRERKKPAQAPSPSRSRSPLSRFYRSGPSEEAQPQLPSDSSSDSDDGASRAAWLSTCAAWLAISQQNQEADRARKRAQREEYERHIREQIRLQSRKLNRCRPDTWGFHTAEMRIRELVEAMGADSREHRMLYGGSLR